MYLTMAGYGPAGRGCRQHDENAEGKQQPHDDANHHDDVENLLIFPSIGM